MQTSSPTILAYERETAKLRADVAELVRALSLVRMSAGWRLMSDETKDIVCEALGAQGAY